MIRLEKSFSKKTQNEILCLFSIQDGHLAGYAEGYDVGYKEGGNGQTTVLENPSTQMDVEGLVFSIPAMFNSILDRAFGYTIFGINVLGLFLSILVIVAIVWLIRKLK